MHIDLNCDLGESFGRYTLGGDADIIPLISSCNIACGMHAGDPIVMRKTVEWAKQAGIAIGAHPGYPDLQGFGRRSMDLSPDEVYSFVLYQIAALNGFCQAAHTHLSHVKPHGQLYNRCAVDTACAQACAQAVYDLDPQLILVGLAGSKLIDAGQQRGLTCAGEFFADRNYTSAGTLVPRRDDQAVITDETYATNRLCEAIRTHAIKALTGETIQIQADTICVHGDNEHARAFVRRIRQALSDADIDIAPVSASK
jgi:UPF0271 protein